MIAHPATATQIRQTAESLRTLLQEESPLAEPIAQALVAAHYSLDAAAAILDMCFPYPSTSPAERPNEHSLLLKMQHYGSGFTRLLAATWLAADPDNAAKLRAAFAHLLPRYEKAPEVPV